MKVKRISILGTGYVGLCTAAAFAGKGYKVVTATHNINKMTLINRGEPPFHEPGLQETLRRAVEKECIRCTLSYEEAVLKTDATFIAVGTPSKPDGSMNLQFIRNASFEIGRALKKKAGYHLVVMKSTVLPGTTENLVKPTVEKNSGKRCGAEFGLSMSPEFLREGSAINDTLFPDRIVIGEYDKKSGDSLETLFRDFYNERLPPTIRTNLPTAELVKYANNAFLAAKISFINEIANICEKIPGVDVITVAKGIGLDRRISSLFLKAGLGYGGSCFPKDVKALIMFSKCLGYTPIFLDAIERVNKAQPHRAVELIKKHLGENLKGKQIAILGLAFKPNTNDVREAVSLKIVKELLEEHANIVVYDCAAMEDVKAVFGDKVKYAGSAVECLKGADCCVLVTEWEEFSKLEPEDFIKNMHHPILIDGRRIYDPKRLGKNIRYVGIGLGKSL